MKPVTQVIVIASGIVLGLLGFCVLTIGGCTALLVVGNSIPNARCPNCGKDLRVEYHERNTYQFGAVFRTITCPHCGQAAAQEKFELSNPDSTPEKIAERKEIERKAEQEKIKKSMEPPPPPPPLPPVKWAEVELEGMIKVRCDHCKGKGIAAPIHPPFLPNPTKCQVCGGSGRVNKPIDD
jgi:hypothetical protein